MHSKVHAPRRAVAGNIAQIVLTVASGHFLLFVAAVSNRIQSFVHLKLIHHFVVLLFKFVGSVLQRQNLFIRVHHAKVGQVCVVLKLLIEVTILTQLLQIANLHPVPHLLINLLGVDTAVEASLLLPVFIHYLLGNLIRVRDSRIVRLEFALP